LTEFHGEVSEQLSVMSCPLVGALYHYEKDKPTDYCPLGPVSRMGEWIFVGQIGVWRERAHHLILPPWFEPVSEQGSRCYFFDKKKQSISPIYSDDGHNANFPQQSPPNAEGEYGILFTCYLRLTHL